MVQGEVVVRRAKIARVRRMQSSKAPCNLRRLIPTGPGGRSSHRRHGKPRDGTRADAAIYCHLWAIVEGDRPRSCWAGASGAPLAPRPGLSLPQTTRFCRPRPGVYPLLRRIVITRASDALSETAPRRNRAPFSAKKCHSRDESAENCGRNRARQRDFGRRGSTAHLPARAMSCVPASLTPQATPRA